MKTIQSQLDKLNDSQKLVMEALQQIYDLIGGASVPPATEEDAIEAQDANDSLQEGGTRRQRSYYAFTRSAKKGRKSSGRHTRKATKLQENM